LDVTDPNGNEGQETYAAYYLINDNTISYVGTSLSTSDIGQESITIFPNPTSSMVTIPLDFSIARVFELTGKVLIESTSETLDLSELPNSLYLISLYDESNRILGTVKVIKE
jgi:hypothetical protein